MDNLGSSSDGRVLDQKKAANKLVPLKQVGWNPKRHRFVKQIVLVLNRTSSFMPAPVDSAALNHMHE